MSSIVVGGSLGRPSIYETESMNTGE